jgi:hypothetical protein
MQADRAAASMLAGRLRGRLTPHLHCHQSVRPRQTMKLLHHQNPID